MNKATQVVNMLLETQIVRVCSKCEQEHGPVPAAPGVQKSHGLCRRHALEAYKDAGIPAEKVMAMPPENFAPDLSESVNPAEAQRFAQDTGLTLHPELQYGSMSSRDVPPELLQQMQHMAMWEFTDRRQGQPSAGITFYVPVNASYDEMMQRWEQKKKEFGL